MTKENDSILVFEYFTASGEKDMSIISEAEALIFNLVDDFRKLLTTAEDDDFIEYYDEVHADFW